MHVRGQRQLLAGLEAGPGEVRVLHAGGEDARLAVLAPAELDVLQALADAHAGLEHGHGVLRGVRSGREDIHAVRGLVRTVHDELVPGIAVHVHRQRPRPQADAEVDHESGVVVFETPQPVAAGGFGLLGPRAGFDEPADELRRIDDHMLGELALPGVRDVHESVRRLDDRRVAELGLGLVLQDQRGLPGDAILAEREVKRAAPFGDMVVDQEVTAVLQRDGVGAGIGIRQVGELDLRPRRALVVRQGAEELGVLGPSDRHEHTVAQGQDAGLDRGGSALPLLHGDPLPGEAVVPATLEMDLPGRPGLQSFGTAAAEDGAILELDGLVLDGAEDAVRQPPRRPPGLAVVLAEADHAPPFDGIGADLIIELQGAFLRAEQHGIPTGVSLAVRLDALGDLHRRRPLAALLPRHPDGDVGFTFGFAREPGRYHGPVARLDDRRGMAAGHGIGLEDELGADESGFGGHQAGKP